MLIEIYISVGNFPPLEKFLSFLNQTLLLKNEDSCILDGAFDSRLNACSRSPSPSWPIFSFSLFHHFGCFHFHFNTWQLRISNRFSMINSLKLIPFFFFFFSLSHHFIILFSSLSHYSPRRRAASLPSVFPPAIGFTSPRSLAEWPSFLGNPAIPVGKTNEKRTQKLFSVLTTVLLSPRERY